MINKKNNVDFLLIQLINTPSQLTNIKDKILIFVFLLKVHLKKFGIFVLMFYKMADQCQKLKFGIKDLKRLILVLEKMDKEY